MNDPGVWVSFYSSFMFYNFYGWDLNIQNLCCISKSMMKHQQKSYQKMNIPFITYGSLDYMCLDSSTKGLFKPWTMKSSQGHVKYVIGCWTHPGTTSVYTKEISSKWSWSPRSPKDIFQGLHYPLTWSNGFCSGRGKWSALVEKDKGPWQRNDIMIFFSEMYFREEEMKTREDNKLYLFFIFSKLPFWAYIRKISTFTFSAWPFLFSHIRFTPSEELKGFLNLKM